MAHTLGRVFRGSNIIGVFLCLPGTYNTVVTNKRAVTQPVKGEAAIFGVCTGGGKAVPFPQ